MTIHLLSGGWQRWIPDCVCVSVYVLHFSCAYLITCMCHFAKHVLMFMFVLHCVGARACMCACGGSTEAPVPLRAHLFCTLCPVN